MNDDSLFQNSKYFYQQNIEANEGKIEEKETL